MMKYLQKLGKALMLPVAVLPICGILMGLGYAFAPGRYGRSRCSNFRRGLHRRLPAGQGRRRTDRQHGMAVRHRRGRRPGTMTTMVPLVWPAWSAYLMMQQLLNPGVVSMVRSLEEGTATYIAFQKVAGNSFIGILAAVIGATCYNKFKSTQTA